VNRPRPIALAALGVVAVGAALWFLSSGQVEDSGVDASVLERDSVPGRFNDGEPESLSVRTSNPEPDSTTEAERTAVPVRGPTPLFGESSEFGEEYARARDVLTTKIGQGLAAHQARVVEIDRDAVSRFFESAKAIPRELDEFFKLPLVAGADCTLWSLERAQPDDRGEYWNVEGTCREFPGSQVLATYVNETGRAIFNVTLRATDSYPLGRRFTIVPIDVGDFSYVAEIDIAAIREDVFPVRD